MESALGFVLAMFRYEPNFSKKHGLVSLRARLRNRFGAGARAGGVAEFAIDEKGAFIAL